MGVTPVQRIIDGTPNSFGIAKHIVVPEPQHAIPLLLDDISPRGIRLTAMLPAIDFDDQLGAMTSEVGDEVTDWYLASKMMIGKVLAKQTPNYSLRVGRVAAKAPGAMDSAWWGMMLQRWRFTANITPPQPLPLKGRGFQAPPTA